MASSLPFSPSMTNPADASLLFASSVEVEEVHRVQKLPPKMAKTASVSVKPGTAIDGWTTAPAPTAWATKTRTDLDTAKKLQTQKVAAARKGMSPTASALPTGKARSHPLDLIGKAKGTGTSVTVVRKIVKVPRPTPPAVAPRASSADVVDAKASSKDSKAKKGKARKSKASGSTDAVDPTSRSSKRTSKTAASATATAAQLSDSSTSSKDSKGSRASNGAVAKGATRRIVKARVMDD